MVAWWYQRQRMVVPRQVWVKPAAGSARHPCGTTAEGWASCQASQMCSVCCLCMRLFSGWKQWHNYLVFKEETFYTLTHFISRISALVILVVQRPQRYSGCGWPYIETHLHLLDGGGGVVMRLEDVWGLRLIVVVTPVPQVEQRPLAGVPLAARGQCLTNNRE